MIFINKETENAKIVKLENYVDEQGLYNGEENLFVLTRMNDNTDNNGTPLNAGNLNKANFKDNTHLEFKTTTANILTNAETQAEGGKLKIYCAQSNGHIWFVPPQGEKIDLTDFFNYVMQVFNGGQIISGIKANQFDAISVSAVPYNSANPTTPYNSNPSGTVSF
jgi:hypothetical protein